jgi:hypothetical protein
VRKKYGTAKECITEEAGGFHCSLYFIRLINLWWMRVIGRVAGTGETEVQVFV